MMGAGNGGRRRRGSGAQRIGGLAALAIVMAVAPGLPLAPGGGPTVAQQGPQSSGTTHLRRELRALELQGLAPNSDIDVYRAQRDVIRQGRGLNFTPEQRRIDRQLGGLQRRLGEQAVGAPPVVPGQPPGSEVPLPRSYGDDDPPLPTSVRTMATVGLLLDRAEQGLAQGRSVQAQSDLATAHSLMPSVAGADPAQVDRLRTRMVVIEARLADAR